MPALSNFQQFKDKITNPVYFRTFMFSKLPAAFFAGLHIEMLNEFTAAISVKQTWFNKNPFGSIYFAILSMTAEVSTGVLCMGAIYKRNPQVSMLVIKSEGLFYKKATGKIIFICNDGDNIYKTVEDAIITGDAKTVTCHSIATNKNGEVVAEFSFTWSFKVKSKRN